MIQQLRGRFVGVEELKDSALRRFLETRSWNVDNAAVQLQKHLDWRAQNLPVDLVEVQAILDDRRVVVLDAVTSDGRPVFMMNLLKMSIVNWKDQSEMNLHLRACVYCAEQMLAGMPGEMGTWTAIVNCSGITAPPQSFLSQFSSVMKANYPETAHKVIMYPIPSLIVKLVTAMMVMMPERTRGKTIFLDRLDRVCEEAGLTAAQLPPELQGRPGDLEMMLDAAEVLEVTAGKVVSHQLPLKAGQQIKWEFRVVEHTINFEAKFSASTSAGGEVAADAATRVAGQGFTLTQLERVTEGQGEHVAEHAGTLEFAFDNGFSYLRGKSMILSVVTVPDQ